MVNQWKQAKRSAEAARKIIHQKAKRLPRKTTLGSWPRIQRCQKSIKVILRRLPVLKKWQNKVLVHYLLEQCMYVQWKPSFSNMQGQRKLVKKLGVQDSVVKLQWSKSKGNNLIWLEILGGLRNQGLRNSKVQYYRDKISLNNSWPLNNLRLLPLRKVFK